MDRWVLRHAVAWLKALPAIQLIDMLSVNLSGLRVIGVDDAQGDLIHRPEPIDRLLQHARAEAV